MIEIKDYIFSRLKRVDSHFNIAGKDLFDDEKLFYADDSILFVNNPIEHKTDSLESYYPLIENDENRYHIAANGKDADEIIDVIDKYNCDVIGELKVYKHYISNETNEELVHEDRSIIDNQYIISSGLPCFIHLDLCSRYAEEMLSEILEAHPERKIVLCHCGINELYSKDTAFERAIKLQHKYENLWLEISYFPVWMWFGKDHRKISKIDTDRLLLGSDFTSYDDITRWVPVIKNMDYWCKIINTQRNVKNLLKI